MTEYGINMRTKSLSSNWGKDKLHCALQEKHHTQQKGLLFSESKRERERKIERERKSEREQGVIAPSL